MHSVSYYIYICYVLSNHIRPSIVNSIVTKAGESAQGGPPHDAAAQCLQPIHSKACAAEPKKMGNVQLTWLHGIS